MCVFYERTMSVLDVHRVVLVSARYGAVWRRAAQAQWARLSDCLDPRSPLIV